jgi:hypothetical protein
MPESRGSGSGSTGEDRAIIECDADCGAGEESLAVVVAELTDGDGGA